MDVSDEVLGARYHHTVKGEPTDRFDINPDPKGLTFGKNEWNKSGVAETTQATLSQRLNLNIVSIVIGALFFLTVATWVDTLRASCGGVINDGDEKRYFLAYRKVWAAVLITLIAIFLSILLYGWYRNHVNFVY